MSDGGNKTTAIAGSHTHSFIPLDSSFQNPTNSASIDIAFVNGELCIRRAALNPYTYHNNPEPSYIWTDWYKVRHN